MINSEKKIMVTRSSMPTFEEYCARIAPLWETHWLTNMGCLHNELQDKLKAFLDCENVSLFSNGHLALTIGLQALGLKGEVITTPFSFASTTHAIVQNGLTPVFCDIREDDYTLDPAKLESLITDRTEAILPVHVYGNVCDTDAIGQIAKKHGLKIIYDAAHAFGVKKNGIGVANFGDFSMFSFHATKVFHTIEGGALTGNSPLFPKKVDMLKNFGITSPETVETVGTNAKMNEFQSAMGLCNLPRVENEIHIRKGLAERYIEQLEGSGLILPRSQPGVEYNYAYFPVRCSAERCGVSRNELFDELGKRNIFPRKYFYPLINDFDCYKGRYDSSATPVAKKIADEVLTLPMYAELTIVDVDRICGAIMDIVR